MFLCSLPGIHKLPNGECFESLFEAMKLPTIKVLPKTEIRKKKQKQNRTNQSIYTLRMCLFSLKKLSGILKVVQ